MVSRAIEVARVLPEVRAGATSRKILDVEVTTDSLVVNTCTAFVEPYEEALGKKAIQYSSHVVLVPASGHHGNVKAHDRGAQHRPRQVVLLLTRSPRYSAPLDTTWMGRTSRPLTDTRLLPPTLEDYLTRYAASRGARGRCWWGTASTAT